MNKTIVITSINAPTNAVKILSKLEDYHVIVVGDDKTPADWKCRNIEFLSIIDQGNMKFKLPKVLSHNHYSRKMIGYLTAVYEKAELIIDLDDDNELRRDFLYVPSWEITISSTPDNMGFVNIYQMFTDQRIWPRGFPLDMINERFFSTYDGFPKAWAKIGIWQGLVSGDTDVDAVYRLTDGKECYFIKRNPVVLGGGTISPFNSQFSITRRELFALLYLPSTVTMRFADILRSLVAQPIMWTQGYQLGICNSDIVQVRNPHNLMDDFVSEFSMYANVRKVVEVVQKAIVIDKTISENLFLAYYALYNAQIVEEQELMILDTWLDDLAGMDHV